MASYIKDNELIAQYHVTKDPELREDLIVRYLPLVHFTLGKLGISKESSTDYDDIASHGTLGLIDAFDRFDPKYGTKFSTYAVIKIRGKVLDHLRSIDWLSRTARQRAKSVTGAINTYWEQNQRMPTDAELAEVTNLEVAEVKKALVDSNLVLVSLDSFGSFESGEEVSLHETLEDSRQADPADLSDKEETKNLLIKAISSLPERDQILLSLYYFENLTFKEIGEVLEVSESRVCQLHTRLISCLKNKIKGEMKIRSPKQNTPGTSGANKNPTASVLDTNRPRSLKG